MLTNKKSNKKYKWFYCKRTKNTKITSSQTWNIKSKTHQGFRHTQNTSTCNNEKKYSKYKHPKKKLTNENQK
jgi:hypothetical protein